MANKAVRTRRRVELEPMNPYERRIIHASLQDNRKVMTRSEGEEPYRKIIIEVKRKERR
jgi:spoIIIJ-associated protein